MAARPWISPKAVREYTQNPTVRDRTDERLKVDIARAEMYVVAYCKHGFTDPEKYPVVPEEVRLAVMLIAEMYAARAEAEATGRSLLKSETNDDYSYTAKDTETAIEDLNVGELLDPHIAQAVRRGIRMDMHIC